MEHAVYLNDIIVDHLQFDSEDPYSVLLFGTGALAVLWLTSAIIGAVDSIPIVCVSSFVYWKLVFCGGSRENCLNPCG